jgi:hypothetical protein
MTDLSKTIAPKSDQLNSDDLIGRNLTIRVTRVSANEGNPEQPIDIYFEGDNGKPYRPCKSMRRVLVQVWGNNGADYAGREMTLYRDPEVIFGGLKVGGTRISHMSHIDKPVTMALTATRANRKPFTVKPLQASTPDTEATLAAARGASWLGTEAFTKWWQSNAATRGACKSIIDELKANCAEADKQKAETTTEEDPFGAAPSEDEIQRAMDEARAEAERQTAAADEVTG